MNKPYYSKEQRKTAIKNTIKDSINNMSKPWWLETWFDKSLFVVGTIALIYTIIRIIIQGVW